MAKGRYRQDKRTDEQFAADIEAATKIERILMDVYVKDLIRRTGKKYEIIDNGVDNTGTFIKDHHKISSNADFILKTQSGKNRLIEIKYSKPDKVDFHLKDDQLRSYLRQDSCIIMFMSISGPNPRYCIIKPSEYQNILDNNKKKVLFGKDQRQCFVKDFIWHPVKIPNGVI